MPALAVNSTTMATTASLNISSIVFAGGGTGGHLFPALAVADALKRVDPSIEVLFLASDRAIDKTILDPTGWPWHPQSVKPFQVKPWRWPRFVRGWRASIRQCQRLFAQHRPGVVVGSGGFVSVPPLVVAHRLGIPIAILNPDAVPGKASRWMASKAERIFVQWDDSIQCFSGRHRVRTTGCPIRKALVHATRADGIREFGLDPGLRTLLITGASQGSRSINDAVVGALPMIRDQKNWQVIHLTGDTDCGRISRAYNELSVRSRVLAFTLQMPLALAAADLVISRAGASTLAELTAMGSASILMPYPFHRDMHQLANARVLERAGAARIVMDRKSAAENLGPLLDCMLPLMRDDELREHMGRCAQSVGRPEAAETIAAQLLDLAGARLAN